MVLTPERLEQVDRELSTLDPGDARRRAVVDRACAVVASLTDVDATLASLAADRRETVARPVASAGRDQPVATEEEDTSPVTDVPPDLLTAEALAALPPDPSLPTMPPGLGSELPPDLRATDPPELGAPSSSPSGAAAESDITGLSVDELFADAEPSPATLGEDSGFADLFEDEPLTLSAAPDSMDSLEAQLEGVDTHRSTPQVTTDSALDEYPAIGDEDPSKGARAHVLSEDDFEDMIDLGGSDEFEELLDDEIQELESAQPDHVAPGESDEEAKGHRGGLIKRLLGRK